MAEQSKYTFYVKSDDGGHEIWKCLAESDEEAAQKVANAGHSDFSLFEKSPVSPERRREAVLARILENPFLGPNWMPLIDAFESVTEAFIARQGFITIDMFARRSNLQPAGSPYLQWLYETDNSLHVELSGNLKMDPPLSERAMLELEFLGWTVPDLRAKTDEGEFADEYDGLPNPFRVFDVEYSLFEAMALTVEALVSVYGVIEEDLYVFGGGLTTSAILKVCKLTQPYPELPESEALLQMPAGAIAFQRRLLARSLKGAGYTRADEMAEHIAAYAGSQGQPVEFLKTVKAQVEEEESGKRKLHELYKRMEDEGAIPPIVGYEMYARDLEGAEVISSLICLPENRYKMYRHYSMEWLDVVFSPLYELPEGFIAD